MKSAYELALERLEQQGIAPPKEEALSDGTRERIAEARRRTEAKLAELEILLRDRLKTTHEADERRQAEEDYTTERKRLEEQLEREIAKLRDSN